ncbi:hypothetical protein AAVH_06829 [Aphelenchoides avenae]|nr:hypothetical protein AAVH_17088 [Aphelenchus avenae]KAH7725647.1 hypothetical protein AAVH_06829 [Aphelenchus avenae]
MAQPSQDDLFETQSTKSVNTSAAILVSTSGTKRELKDAVASIGGGGSASTFATPKPAKVRRLLEPDEASTKSSMQLDVVELQRMVLHQQLLVAQIDFSVAKKRERLADIRLQKELEQGGGGDFSLSDDLLNVDTEYGIEADINQILNDGRTSPAV